MALICCPECNAQISSKAIACPHCGFPLAELSQEYVAPEPHNNDTLHDDTFYRIVAPDKPAFWNASGISGVLNDIFKENDIDFSTRIKSPPCIIADGITKINAVFLEDLLRIHQFESIVEETKTPFNKEYNEAISKYKTTWDTTQNEFLAEKAANQPKCPTCGSTNIKEISFTRKAIGAATFGLFSKTARSQFVCNRCGYKW